MEKRIWTKPEMNEFAFAANEYVAACGDSGNNYLFKCNAPGGILYYFKKILTGDNAGQNEENPTRLGDFVPNPNKTHLAPTTDEFFDGFLDKNNNQQYDDEDTDVIVWLEYGNFWGHEYLKDYHATTELDVSSWEIDKS